jgi:periplasmic divalent cation tolerance protein
MQAMLVYVTASDSTEAERIGRAAVEERLAACANILSGMRSLYWWQGRIEEGAEAVLILKTTRARLAALMARVRDLHSYDCPCIEALEIADGNPDFLAWIVRETHSAKG